MFDLEGAIAQWRKRLSRYEAFRSADLDEMESHLRDGVDRFTTSGFTQKEAFYRAVCSFGDGTELAKRFNQANWEQVMINRTRFAPHLIGNYLKVAFRNFLRQKVYSTINVAGLSVGLACSFLIFMWVTHELSYDQFHVEGDRIHRLLRNHHGQNKVSTLSSIPAPSARLLKERYPEVTETVLVTWNQPMHLTYGEQTFRERGYHADTAFFKVFTFPLILGDPETALAEPNNIAISEATAEKYFGADWRNTAMGQSIVVNNTHALLRYDSKSFKVAAVYENMPANSTLKYAFILPMASFRANKRGLERWTANQLRLYVQLQKGVDLDQFNAKIKNMIKENDKTVTSDAFLQPYLDVHLYSDFRNGRLVGGRIDYVQMFIVVAAFIIVIASINFMNLSTARSTQRAQEIGIRKAVGAHKSVLIGQFMGESLIMTLLAAVVALIMVILILPAFSDLINQTLTMDLFSLEIILVFFGIAILTGLLAGSYPAFYLSNFNPVVVLRGSFTPGSGASQLRQVLVVFQFGLSILLIIGTLTVYEQITYMRNKNLGMERNNLMYMQLEGNERKQYETFRRELLQQPGIVGVTSTAHNPLRVTSTGTNARWEGRDPSSEHVFHRLMANYDVVKTFEMEIVHGREFSRDFPSDRTAFMVNEEMARVMGKENPVGTRLTFGREGEIVGVVKNFHFQSLYSAIEPLIIRLDPNRTEYLFVRIAGGQTAEAIEGMEKTFRKFNSRNPFTFSFQDEQFESMYRNESTMGTLATFFAILAIFISCLGLFGLAAFTAEQRTKEIGIRKVLGASIFNLVGVLSKEFIRLVIIAFALAAPLAYHFMSDWLNSFAYHTSLGWRVFVFAGVISAIIAGATVSYQAVKAALANPIESLRYE